MITIVGISGSLRRGSFNTALLRAAAEVAPEGVRVCSGDISDIPLYNGDVEAASGVPAAVTELKNQLIDADGILLVTPEYNGSMPGVLKNAIDWLSRPGDDIPKVFGGKPVAVMGATPGGLGTVNAQQAWLPVLKALRTRPWFGTPMTVSRAHTLFDEDGRLTDDATRERLTGCMQEFTAFVRRQGS